MHHLCKYQKLAFCNAICQFCNGQLKTLLNLFLEDSDLFKKVIVLVNNPLTIDKICQTIRRTVKNDTMLFRQSAEDAVTVQNISEFLTTGYRILLAVNDDVELSDVYPLPFIVHFDLPEDKDLYIRRVINHEPDIAHDKILISLATDLELNLVKKIEQATGVKIPEAELPEELKIETARIIKASKFPPEEPIKGGAFHQKKPENAKTYNYSSGLKAKMNKKKKHG